MRDLSFENLLTSYRTRMGWTQHKVAEALEVSLRSYQAWENGKRHPPNAILRRMANIFELNDAEADQLYRATAYPPRIPWAGKQVSIQHVEEQLAHFWRMSTDNVRISQNMNVGTSVLNLVICVPTIEAAQEASTLVRDLSSTHIARILLLILDESAPDMVATWVMLRSFPIVTDVTRHSFEQITLIAQGSAVRSLTTIVSPLLKPDLPVYLWWLHDPPAEQHLFESLVALSNRLIVDSASFLTPEASMRSLSSLVHEVPNRAVSDLNWGRLTRWRELVVQFFDSSEYVPYLRGIDRIDIEHSVALESETRAMPPNATSALLLAGWLKTRLGWRLRTDSSEHENDASTGTHFWSLDCPTGMLGTRSRKTDALPALPNGHIFIRPRVQPHIQLGSLCMVRLISNLDEKHATFVINREDDDPEHVVTSVELSQATHPQRTVTRATIRKASDLLHDELEIVSRDPQYEQALEEASDLLLEELQRDERTQTPQSILEVDSPNLTTAIWALIRSASDFLQLLPDTLFSKVRDFSVSEETQDIRQYFNEKQQIWHLEIALKNAAERGLAEFQTLPERVQYGNVLNVLSEPGTGGNILRREALRLFTLSEAPDIAKLNEIYSRSLRILSLQSPSDVDVTPYLSSFFNALIAELYVDPFFRQQLSDVLQLRVAQNMHRSLVEIVTTLHKIGTTIADYYTPEQFEQDIATYATHVERTYHYFKLIGLVPKEQSADPELDAIFVSPRVTIQGPSKFDDKAQDSIINLLEGYPYLVLLGGPSSGKSTISRYLAWSHAVANQWTHSSPPSVNSLSGTPLPLRIELRHLSEERRQHPYSFLSYATEVLLGREGVEVNPQVFRELLERRMMLLLFDGLDEVATLDERRQLIQEIEQFVQTYPGNRILVTSRPVGYELTSFSKRWFRHAQIQEFDNEQIYVFLERWYTSVLRLSPIPANDREELELLYRTLVENQRLHVLASNPLLLTVIAALHRYERLPDRRVQIYDRCADLMLETWAKIKGTGARWKDVRMAKDDQYTCIAHIGFVLHQRTQEQEEKDRDASHREENLSPETNASYVSSRFLLQEIERFIAERNLLSEVAERRAEARRFLDLIRLETGFIVERGTDESGEVLYGFMHRIFQEYFAAADVYERFQQEIDITIVSNFLAEHLHDPHWREVTLLLLGKLKSRTATNLLRSLLQDQLISRPSKGTDITQQDLFFVCDCLAEEIAVEKELVELVISRLDNIVIDAPTQQRTEAFKALASLLRTRQYSDFTRRELITLINQNENISVKILAAQTLYQSSSDQSEERQLATQTLLNLANRSDLVPEQTSEAAQTLYLISSASSQEQFQAAQVLLHIIDEPQLPFEQAAKIAETIYEYSSADSYERLQIINWMTDSLGLSPSQLLEIVTAQSLGENRQPFAELLQHAIQTTKLIPTRRWYLQLEVSPSSQIHVGQRLSLTLHTTAHEPPKTKSTPIRIPVNALEMAIYIEAPSFYLNGQHRSILHVVNGLPVEENYRLPLSLIPLINGNHTIQVLVYPGGRIDGIKPTILSYDISIAAPVALPDIPELIDHRTIPDPQPDVTLYLSLEEIQGGQHLQMHITCPILGLNQEPLDPLPLTEADLWGLRQATIQVAANSTNAPPADVLMSLQTLGAALFDQLMPHGHQLRGYYWDILRLATISSTPWSWLVISDNRAVLPWELLCPYYRQLQTAETMYGDFLASKFVLAHWVGRQGIPIMSEAPIGWLALSHSNQHLTELSRWRTVLDYHTPEEGMDGLLAFLQPDLPFYGLHILRYIDQYEAGKITYAAEQEHSTEFFRNEGERIVSRRHLDFTLRRPVLGLSLVDDQQAHLFSSRSDTNVETDWFLPFMQAGASALVGPRWTVPSEIDQLFFRNFYDAIHEGIPLGLAVWVARTSVKQAFPDQAHWLAYTYFGHPRCEPYQVQPAQGFTLFEVLKHPEDAPFNAGQSYQFRASYRAEAPLWYQGRLHTQQGYLRGEDVSVMVVPLTGGVEPKTYPLEPVSVGSDYQCVLTVTMPQEEGTLPVLVRFQEGKQELRTLVLNFDVIERARL